MRLPDFLIIGAARSGTTTLHELLRSHPRVFLPANKRPEPHFFLRDGEYRKGIAHYAKKYFNGVGDDVTAGESSTSYIYSRKACTRIHQHLPDIRILSILRSPVDRAFSHFRTNVHNGLEPLGFSEAIRAEEHRLKHPRSPFEEESSPYSYIDRGRYFRQLSRYRSAFGNRRICVILLDDLTEDPTSTISQITDFLRIPRRVECGTAGNKFNQTAEDGIKISDEDRRFVIGQVRSDVNHLERWLNRDLQHWVTP
jgi:hypothetical protein